MVIAEASEGHPEAAARRLEALEGIAELLIDEEVIAFAERLITECGIPEVAKADALHVSVAAVHNVDYLLTWNCHISTTPQENPSFALFVFRRVILILKFVPQWNY